MERKVVITGGSSGLGLSLARALAARGDSVALVARDAAKLEKAAEDIGRGLSGGTVVTLATDVQNEDALRSGLDMLADKLGGIDVLVNSAGILKEGYFETLPSSTHRDVMAVNYLGTVNAIRAALPHLKKSGRGRIVNVASVAGLTGVFGYSAYCASKYALVGLSEALRFEFAPQGITVQVICPGEFDSPMVDELDRYRTPENREHTLAIPKVSVDVIVEAVVRGLAGTDFLIVPGKVAKLSVLGLRHLPAVSRRVGDARVRKVYVGPKAKP
jgi:3-dehydrosphinganine reductase